MVTRDNIRKIISERYRSPRDFAARSGISYVYLNKLLNGHVRLNDEFAAKLAGALGVPIYQLFAEKPLVEYESREPILNFNMPEGELEGVKMFEDPICLGPGYNMDELKPEGYMPILKVDLPRGYKSDRDRIVCFKTKGYSMEPTIFDDSYAWIDRYVESCKVGDICAFLLPDNAVTVKRLLSRGKDHLIIGADNPAQAGFPMVLQLRDVDDASIVRGHVIWVLNRLIEKPNK